MKALSIRQPWAWLIANSFKDIENRSWNTKYRGPILIHAASGLTQHEYRAAMEVCRTIHPDLPVNMPLYESIERGGIVGMATITGTCESSSSPWFFGPVGFQLKDARTLPFYPMRGRLSFFDTLLEIGENGHLVPEERP